MRDILMTNDIQIREAAVTDLPACATIVNDYIDETPWLPRTISHAKLEQIFNAEMLQSRFFLVAKSNNAVAGYLSMEEAIGKIHGLYVAARYRGAGVGKALMAACKKRYREPVNLTVFEPNKEALRFYQREGFVEVPKKREADTEEGVPTLFMQWSGRHQT